MDSVSSSPLDLDQEKEDTKDWMVVEETKEIDARPNLQL